MTTTTTELVVEIVRDPTTRRQHIDWYRTRDDMDRHFPILTANRHGVRTSPCAQPDEISDGTRAIADAAHKALANNPDANMYHLVRPTTWPEEPDLYASDFFDGL